MMKAQPETMAAEQAADLAALQAAANDTDAGPVPGEVGQDNAPPQIDLGQEIAGLMKVALATLGPAFPSLEKIYTPETIGAASESIAAVCRKHGWMQGGMMGEYAEEITCLFVVGPLALATVQGVKADIAARAKKPDASPQIAVTKPEAVPTETPGAKTVSFGAPAPAEA